jgi:hypothetical protein
VTEDRAPSRETMTRTAAWVSTSPSGMRKPLRVRICRKPSAARRNAKGSREPVGFSPIEKKETSVSILSAMLTAIVTLSVGTSSP